MKNNLNLLRFLALMLTGWFVWAVVLAHSQAVQSGKVEKQRADNFYQISEADTPLVDAAAAAVRVSPKLSRVWKNYWSPAQAFIIYKPGKSALLVSKTVPPPFQPVAPSSLPSELRGKSYFYEGALAGLAGNFNTDYRIGEQSAIAVKLEESTYQTVDVLFHEGFHKFQKAAFARTAGADGIELQAEDWIDPEVVSKPEFVAATEVERRMLSQMINTVSASDLKRLLRQYLIVRAVRTRNLPSNVRQVEMNIERKEGTAAVVGSEAAFLATGKDRRTVSEQLKMFMSEPPKSLPMGNFPYERFRARSFGSGAALAWLLTRMKTDWRMRSQRGASFETLIAEAVEFKPEAETASAEIARQAFGFFELLKEAEAWKSKIGSGFTVAEFHRKGKVRLVIEIPYEDKHNLEFKGMGAGIPSQPEKNIVIFPNAQAFSLDYRKISLNGENCPYLLDFRAMPRLYRITIMLDELPTVEGSEERATEIQWTAGGVIEGAGIKLKVERPAAVFLKDDSIIVQIGTFPSD